MTLSRTRPASLRAAVMALLLGWLAVVPLSPARAASPADGWPDFVPTPSNPAPPFPTDLLNQPNARQLPPVPMPQDRAADSYRIYSVLLPVGELGRPGWSRALWLLSDTTVSIVPSDQSCSASDADGTSMNPHVAVQPPPDRQQDFAELLNDFDRHCHERIHLTSEAFNLVVPLRLLNPSEQDEFIRTRFDPEAGADGDAVTARYKGAPGISRFSAVYFNAHHTLAMVFASGWCGGVCAQSFWQVVELQDGSWKRLGWRTASLMN